MDPSGTEQLTQPLSLLDEGAVVAWEEGHLEHSCFCASQAKKSRTYPLPLIHTVPHYCWMMTQASFNKKKKKT